MVLFARIETECKTAYEDDSDTDDEYIFNPLEAFNSLAKEQAGYAIRLERGKKQLHAVPARMSILEQQNASLAAEVAALKHRVQHLEEQNA